MSIISEIEETTDGITYIITEFSNGDIVIIEK